MSEQILRLFVAIPLVQEVKKALQDEQARLKRILPTAAATWARPASMHLTLRFLGNVVADRLPELSQVIRTSVSDIDVIHLICERLGCFPHSRLPRVIWAGIQDETGQRLALLHRQIDQAVTAFAEKPGDECFVGHITLGRFKQIKRAEAERLARFLGAAAATRYGSWQVQTVELIQSELSAQGSQYTTLDVFPL